MESVKQSGCCSVCDKIIFTQKPAVDADRVPRFIPAVGARRLHVVLASGNTTHYSVCKDCDMTPENTPTVWRKAIRGMSEQAVDPSISTDVADSRRRVLWLFSIDPPLGILTWDLWSEVMTSG